LTPVLIIAHASLTGVMVALFLLFPYFILQNRPITLGAAGLTFGISVVFVTASYTLLRKLGLSFLRFVTLVPVVLVIGFILKIAAPQIDAYYSARPVAAELKQLGTQDKLIAVFNARRELRFGLTFYRNQNVFSYDEGTIPVVGHVLVARFTERHPEEELERKLPRRKLLKLASFKPQKLDFFWVSPEAR
jgi:hypothetical protein